MPPRDPRVLRISGPRGIETVSGARRPPRSLSSPTPLFLGRTRLPSSSGGQGPDLLRGRAPDPARPRALRARRLPRGRGYPVRPTERQHQPGRCGRWRRRRTGTRGRLGFWLRRPPYLQPEGRGTPSEAASPLPAGRREGAGSPKLRLGVNCTRAASLIHVSGVEEPRSPAPGGRKVLYKCFVEGVLSPAKISQ